MAYKLPDLPYDYNALEPIIDEQTMRLHHDKHHNTYVTKLNDAIQGKGDLEGKSIEDLMRNLANVPEDIRGAVRNNGGGHANHSMFWEIMAPKGQGGDGPSGELATAVDNDLGGVDKMKDAVLKAATTQFGSGWAWVIVNEQGKLEVTKTPNQDTPLMGSQFVDKPGTPILGIDVWEHAYYLKYQNKRPDYVNAWWDVVNWNKVGELYAQAKK